MKLTVRCHAGHATDVQVTGSEQTTLAELRPLLTDGCVGGIGTISNEDGPLSPASLLGSAGLLSGSVITVGACNPRRPTSVGQLRVISGPDCGQLVPLTRGVHVIGRSADADITIDDPDLSRRHIELRLDLHGTWMRDLGSTNGSWLDGTEVSNEPRLLPPRRPVTIGSTRLLLVDSDEPPAACRAAPDGRVLVNRPPIIAEPIPDQAVHFPGPVDTDGRPKLRWLVAVLPAVLALALASAMHNGQFLAFALLSPVTMLAANVSERRDWRRGRRQRRLAYAAAEQAAHDELEARLLAESARRTHSFPDAVSVARAAEGPNRRLWERRPSDAPFLQVRLGLADQRAETRAIMSGRSLPARTMKSVPATVDLRSGPIGLTGPLPLVRGSARWLMAQVLTLHSPREVKVMALLDGERADWRWLRWADAAVTAIATSADTRERMLDDLRRLAHERGEQQRTGDWQGAWVVLLVDPARLVAEHAGLHPLLENGAAIGITALCVDRDRSSLPPSCHVVAAFSSETGSMMQIAANNQQSVQAIADRVGPGWADQLSRNLAPLRDADTDSTTVLPDEVRLTELLAPRPITSQQLQLMWSRSRSASTPIGMCAAGALELDLVRDGPHLLIAGTTGSGKSELLRSFVIGMAARSAPQDLAFVLIDYKGGAAFYGCENLPHTLGLVTDLDGHLTARALTSLQAELRNREGAFARAGVADLEDYRTSPEAALHPLPRLVLVVDEFASLAEELPNFLSGLIGVAQRGRSLGLHLVLATQRPAGVVSPEIKANMSLRIALRVTDSAESSDVIASGAAAWISKKHPGRAFAQIAGELVEFQTARVAVPVAPADEVRVTELGFWNEPPQPAAISEGAADDQSALCAAIKVAAGLQHGPMPLRPWLPPLPAQISSAQLGTQDRKSHEVAFGLVDDPAQQRQQPAVHDLVQGGSIGFIGGARSGRTTALRTILGQAAGQLPPHRLNLYVIDCAAQSFGALVELPHCGAVVGRDDPPNVARLVSRLLDELADRQRQLAAHGMGSLEEAYEDGLFLPSVLLAIDGWEALTALSDELDGGRTADSVIQLIRDGAAVGFSVLVTGDRATLGLRIGPALRRKFILPMTDRADYQLAGLSRTNLPARLSAGQAFGAEDGLEARLAILGPDRSPAAQWQELHRIALPAPSGTRRWTGPSVRILPLPSSVRYLDLPVNIADSPPNQCALGVGGDDAAPIHCDLFAEHSRFLITGPPRSGRSNAMVVIAQQARKAALRLLIAAPARSPLARWAATQSITVIGPTGGFEGAEWGEPAELGCDVILVDDAERFLDTSIGDVLTELAAHHHAAFVAATRAEDLMISFRGIGVEVRRHRTGLLLQPGVGDGELLGVRIGPQRSLPLPGRGLLISEQTRAAHPSGLPIQVAS